MSGNRDGDADFLRRIEQIEESERQARQYLERTEPKVNPDLSLPLASWIETGTAPLSVAKPGEPICRARAILEVHSSPPYGAVGLKFPVPCIRELGHDGLHALVLTRSRAHI